MQISASHVVAQVKPEMSVPLLRTPFTYQSGVICLILASFLALCVWDPVSDFPWEAPSSVNLQWMSPPKAQRNECWERGIHRGNPGLTSENQSAPTEGRAYPVLIKAAPFIKEQHFMPRTSLPIQGPAENMGSNQPLPWLKITSTKCHVHSEHTVEEEGVYTCKNHSRGMEGH